MKTKDLRDLLTRAAAVIEQPGSEDEDEKSLLIEDLVFASQELNVYPVQGWRLAPVEPTEAMVVAGVNAHDTCDSATDIWAAMLAAAPTPAGGA